MKKILALLVFLSALLYPILSRALTNEEREGKEEIAQGWVDRHNEKLPAVVREAVLALGTPRHAFRIQSLHAKVISMKRVHGAAISKNGIPMETKSADGTIVPLAALYQSKAQGLSFLTADYSDELDGLHSSSDIYIKIGLQYRPLFHGEGYRGSARLVALGENSPLFFEVGIFKGGSGCDKTIYTLNADAVKAIPDDLYDHPEGIDPQKYIQEALQFSIWLEGYTLYKDVDKDGALEIINGTEAEYPEELKAKLNQKYGLKGADFAGAFRPTASVFKWDAVKKTFEDLGDYYY